MGKQLSAGLYSPLGRRLLLAVVGISTLIALVSSLVIIYLDYKNGIEDYQKNLIQIQESYQKSLSYSLWNFDTQQLQAQLKGIMNFPGLVYAQIDNDGKTILSIGDIYQPSQQSLLVALKYENNDKVHFLGNLRINQSYDELYDILMRRAIDILLSQFVLIFLISVLLLVALHNLVTRRLGILAKWALNFNLDKLNDELVIDDSKGQLDELSQVAQAINRMRQTIKNDIALRQETIDKNEQLQRQLTLAVDNTALGFCCFDAQQNRLQCNSHFASHFASHEAELESLCDPLAFLLRCVSGEDSEAKKERIAKLLTGELHRLDDTFCISNHSQQRMLQLSFQAIRYQDNRPQQILICSLDKSEEHQIKAQLKTKNDEFTQEIASLTQSQHAQTQDLLAQLSALRKDFLRLQNRQRPQHLTLLFHLMSKSLEGWQRGEKLEDWPLWNEFLGLKLFDLRTNIDIVQYAKGYFDQLLEHYPLEVNFDVPFSIMLEEGQDVLDFFSARVLGEGLISQCRRLDVQFKIEPKRLICRWHFYARDKLLFNPEALPYALARIVVNIRYNGELSFTQQDEQLITQLILPFET